MAFRPFSQPTILLVRHGNTPLNDSNELRGWLDVPLSPDARPAIEATARELANNLLMQLVSSDLERARQTTKMIHSILRESGQKVTPSYDRGLRPWNLGVLTGIPWDEAKIAMSVYVDKPEEPIPGGESLNDLVRRFLPRLHEMADLVRRFPPAAVVCVTHSRNHRLAAAHCAAGFYNMNLEKAILMSDKDPVEPAGVLALTYENGKWNAKPLVKGEKKDG